MFGFIFGKPLNQKIRIRYLKFIQLKASLLHILYSIVFLFSFQLKSQEKFSDNLYLDFNHSVGYILPEYQFLNYVVSDYTRTYEFSFLKQTKGKSEWEQLYHYPAYGFRFIYTDLGSPDVLGELVAAYPYFQVNIADFKKLKIYNQTGLGLSYVNKKFDLIDNYWNVAVGSHWNLHFNARFGLEYHLSKKLKIHSALSFDHFSNANTSEPNLGINMLTWNSGLSLAIGGITEMQTKDLSEIPKTIEQEFIVNIGGKHSRALSSNYYLTNSISYEVRKKYFRAFHLGIGADAFYDSSVEDQLLDSHREYHPINQFQTGLHISQTIVYNRFSISLQEGIYLGLTEKVEHYSMYNRGIFKYWLTDNFSLRFSMKSHLHILDYPEIGIGIKL